MSVEYILKENGGKRNPYVRVDDLIITGEKLPRVGEIIVLNIDRDNTRIDHQYLETMISAAVLQYRFKVTDIEYGSNRISHDTASTTYIHVYGTIL